MPDTIQYLGSWQALEPEVMKAMLDLAEIAPGDKFIDLGCGDGQFLKEATARGAQASGIEIDPSLVVSCISANLDVTQGDVFDADVSKATVITFWFTDTELTPKLMDKLYAEMKKNAKLVMLHSSRKAWRDGVFLPDDNGVIDHVWQPSKTQTVLDNRFHLYIR